jgi:hypothetical protein
MTCTVVAASLILSAASLSAQNYITFRDKTSEELFRNSRMMLGGEGAIVRLESLILKGHTVASLDDGGPAKRDVELRILLPNHYQRIETAGTFVRRIGFSGDRVLTSFEQKGVVSRPPDTLHDAMLRTERAAAARMLFGLAAIVTPEMWLTIRMSPTGTGSPLEQTMAVRVVDEHDRDRLGVDLILTDRQVGRAIFDSRSVPYRVEHESSQNRLVRTTFLDRRRVDGLLLPQRITTEVNGRRIDDFVVTAVIVNPKLTAADFTR